MDILYCGDENIKDGLLISILSLLKTVPSTLHIYVLTIKYKTETKTYNAIPDKVINYLDKLVKGKDKESFVKKIDITDMFVKDAPKPNMRTLFTPCCMIRLFADQVDELPEKILYLDNDIICRKDITEFYNQDVEGYEVIGVLDHYGKWFYKKKMFKFDYLNSGVLLMNLKMIKETKLFEKCRYLCKTEKVRMPDQASINRIAISKKSMPRKYNEQRKLHDDTVIQHFTTSFRFFPIFHPLKVKPWQIDRVHKKLHLHEYDDLLNEYLKLKENMS